MLMTDDELREIAFFRTEIKLEEAKAIAIELMVALQRITDLEKKLVEPAVPA